MSVWDGVSEYLTTSTILGLQRIIYDQPWAHDRRKTGAEKRNLVRSEIIRVLRSQNPGKFDGPVKLPRLVERIIDATYPIDGAPDLTKIPEDELLEVEQVPEVTFDELNSIKWTAVVRQSQFIWN